MKKLILLTLLTLTLLTSCGTKQSTPEQTHVPEVKGPASPPRIGQPTSPPP